MTLRDAWEQAAEKWIEWARTPDHDVYWRFHREALFDLIPAPGLLTLDIGCGEGRVARDLSSLGHRVVGIDGSATMARAATTHPASHGPVAIADAARLPLRDGVADLAVAFMSFQDVDDFAAAIAEASRVLRQGGAFVMAIVHPLTSVGGLTQSSGKSARPRFVITEDYFADQQTKSRCNRGGLAMTFHSAHRPVSAYTEAIYDSGLLIERVKEPTDTDATSDWSRVPMFLHIRAVKT